MPETFQLYNVKGLRLPGNAAHPCIWFSFNDPKFTTETLTSYSKTPGLQYEAVKWAAIAAAWFQTTLGESSMESFWFEQQMDLWLDVFEIAQAKACSKETP